MKLQNNKVSQINSFWDSDEPESILLVAQKALRLISSLAEVDTIFETFFYVPRSKTQTKFDLKKISKEDAIHTLAKCILDDKRGGIKFNEKGSKPCISYSRDSGFSLLINFKIGNRIAFSYTPDLGIKGRNRHALTYFKKGFSFDYRWFVDVFKTLISTSNPIPFYGSIGLSDIHFLRKVRKELKVIWPIQIANYFSPDLEWIAKALDTDLHYTTDKSGVFIFPTKPDFMVSDEALKSEIERMVIRNKKVAFGNNVKKNSATAFLTNKESGQ